MKLSLSFILAIFFYSSTALATPEIKICYEDVTVYPWITGDESGLAITEVRYIEKMLNLKIKLVRLPWKRCQLEAKTGKLDGLIAASYLKERTVWGVYPTNVDGTPDRKYRLHTDSYIVVVRKDSQIRWVNNKFENLNQDAVGTQLGYSVGVDLKNAGYHINSSFSTTADVFGALNSNLLKVAVVQNYSANKLISEKPKYRKYVALMDEPYKVVDQYLLFSKSFFEKNQEIGKKIWNAIPAARKSAEYLKLERELMGKL